jgi:hypothetical protein
MCEADTSARQTRKDRVSWPAIRILRSIGKLRESANTPELHDRVPREDVAAEVADTARRLLAAGMVGRPQRNMNELISDWRITQPFLLEESRHCGKWEQNGAIP